MKIILSDFIRDSLTSKKNSSNRFFLQKNKYRVWKYSFSSIYDYSCRFAAYLLSRGIVSGDRVILKGINRPEWVISFIGSLLYECIIVPLDVKSDEAFDLKVAGKVSAKAVICDNEESAGYFKKAGLKIIFLDYLTDLLDSQGRSPDFYNGQGKDFLDDRTFAELLFNKKIDPDSLAEIVFTSGTTSEPKGVKITFGNVQSSLELIIPVMQKYSKIFNMMHNPRILTLVPLSHMYGQLIGIFTPLMINASVMFTNNFSPRHILKTVKEEKIWILGTLPKMLEMIKNHIVEKYGLDKPAFLNLYRKMQTKRWQLRFLRFSGLHYKIGLRFVALMVGGAVLDKSLDEFFRCIAYAIFQGYGLTETTPIVTLSDPVGSVAGSIGKILPGQQVKIIDGEIYVKGPNVSTGYYDDKERTGSAFLDGWFKTGDLVEVDKDGNMFFKGRKDDVIVRQDGLNIFPEDIEAVIKADKRVKDSAVLGIKSEGKDLIIAVLLLKDLDKKHAYRIIEEANKKLNVYQKIDKYFIWKEEDFPRTPTLKVKKNILEKSVIDDLGRYPGKRAGGIGDSGKTATMHTAEKIISGFHKLKGRRLKPGDKLENDVGLDSLELIELSSEIETKYNLELNDSVITKDTTIEELENILINPPKESKKMPFYNFPYWMAARILRTSFQYLLLPFMFILFRLKVRGRENLKNLKGPVVFTANHSSNLDTFAVLYSMPLKFRQRVTALMSIEHHFRNFFYRKGNIFRRAAEAAGFYLLVNLAVNACPLSRTHGFRQALENTGKLIDKGWSILIFPEGGVTTDGEIKNFESGVGIIAEDMRIPVIPVKICGLYNLMRNGILPWGHMPKWPLVTVTFGKPLLLKNKNYHEIAITLEDIIRNQL